MATVATGVNDSVKPRSAPPGRRYDHYFFSAMALLLLGTVFLGFAHTYYLAGLFHAPLPNLLIHIHGAVFSTWILLLIMQTSLVAAGRVDIHRRLGIAGFLLACLMILLGVLAATDSLARALARPGFDPLTFYIIPMTDILSFSVLTFFAFRARLNPPAHKRLILVATTALMVAAIARWPFAAVLGKPYIAALFTNVFLLLLVFYDLWSTRKIHRATLWASVFLIFVQQIRQPISHTASWHSFAAWAQHLRL
jgi:hypothetical protein